MGRGLVLGRVEVDVKGRQWIGRRDLGRVDVKGRWWVGVWSWGG